MEWSVLRGGLRTGAATAGQRRPRQSRPRGGGSGGGRWSRGGGGCASSARRVVPPPRPPHLVLLGDLALLRQLQREEKEDLETEVGERTNFTKPSSIPGGAISDDALFTQSRTRTVGRRKDRGWWSVWEGGREEGGPSSSRKKEGGRKERGPARSQGYLRRREGGRDPRKQKQKRRQKQKLATPSPPLFSLSPLERRQRRRKQVGIEDR